MVTIHKYPLFNEDIIMKSYHMSVNFVWSHTMSRKFTVIAKLYSKGAFWVQCKADVVMRNESIVKCGFERKRCLITLHFVFRLPIDPLDNEFYMVKATKKKIPNTYKNTMIQVG